MNSNFTQAASAPKAPRTFVAKRQKQVPVVVRTLTHDRKHRRVMQEDTPGITSDLPKTTGILNLYRIQRFFNFCSSQIASLMFEHDIQECECSHYTKGNTNTFVFNVTPETTITVTVSEKGGL